MVNGKQHSVWFVPTGMKGLPQNVLLNFRLEIPKSDLTIYFPSGISEIFCQMVSTPNLRFARFRGRKEREIGNWICNLGNLSPTRAICTTARCMTFADCRLQTADRRLQTADCMRQQDCKLNETKNIVIKVASSSTLPCSEKCM